MKIIAIIDSFVKKYMPLVILVALAGGYFVGLHLSRAAVQGIKSSILPLVVVMIYAMLITMKMDELKEVFLYPKEIIYGSVLSLLIAPLLMIPLATIFTNNTGIYVGLLLAAIMPPGGMVTYWSGILDANIGLAISLEAITLLIAIFWVPYGMKLLVGSKVNVNTAVLLHKIVIVIIVPLTFALITQKLITHKSGWKGILKIKPLCHLISSLIAFYMVFVATSVTAHAISRHLSFITLPALGMLIYYGIAYPFSYYISLKIFRIPFSKSIPITYGFSTKNLSLAMGIAVAAFGPMALLGVVPCMLFQMPLAAMWFKFFSKIKAKNKNIANTAGGFNV